MAIHHAGWWNAPTFAEMGDTYRLNDIRNLRIAYSWQKTKTTPKLGVVKWS
jgi:hypothetical protein